MDTEFNVNSEGTVTSGKSPLYYKVYEVVEGVEIPLDENWSKPKIQARLDVLNAENGKHYIKKETSLAQIIIDAILANETQI